jgi:hypothetical protein
MLICEKCGKECKAKLVREDCDDGVGHSLGNQPIYYLVANCNCESNYKEE